MSKTIVLVHGAWVTPACWASFKGYFEEHGHEVLTPPWPYLDRTVEELQSAPDPRLARQTVKGLVDHYDAIIRALPAPPIIMGHSFGGLITQMLLDRGLGSAGVAIDPGPPRGVIPSLTAIRSAAPVLFAWNGWNRVLSMSFDSFAKTFANTLPDNDLRPTYRSQIVPAPGRIYFQAALGIGIAVNFKNHARAPLLLVTASQDKTSTPSMVRAMHRKHSSSPVRTDFVEFKERSHWLIAEPGWEDIARHCLEWSAQFAKTS